MTATRPTDPIEELAAVIREAMLDRRIIETDLEHLVHHEVTRDTITGIVNANSGDDWTTIRTIAHELGCDIRRLERLWTAAGRRTAQPQPSGNGSSNVRRQLGISQRRMAARMGVSKTAYQRYEHDRSLPEARRLPALAQALRIPTSRLGRWLNDSPLRTGPADG